MGLHIPKKTSPTTLGGSVGSFQYTELERKMISEWWKITWYYWWKEFLHQLICVLSHYFQGFTHSRWWSPDFWTINRTTFLPLFTHSIFHGLASQLVVVQGTRCCSWVRSYNGLCSLRCRWFRRACGKVQSYAMGFFATKWWVILF